MVSIKTLITTDSKASPGISFTVRSLSRRERAAREFDLIESRRQIQDAAAEWTEINKTPEDQQTAEQKSRSRVLDARYAILIERDVKPAVIAAGLVSISGLEIDGRAADPASLLRASDSTNSLDALIDEIYEACCEASGLTEKQQKNSESPTISSEPVVGEQPSSIAAEDPAGA